MISQNIKKMMRIKKIENIFFVFYNENYTELSILKTKIQLFISSIRFFYIFIMDYTSTNFSIYLKVNENLSLVFF